MTTQQVKRKLAAILSADVKGYSRIVRQEESSSLAPSLFVSESFKSNSIFDSQ